MYMIHFAWPIKHVAVKPTLVIQLMHVTVKCKVIVFAVMIVNVVVVFVRKQYPNYNLFFPFYWLSYVWFHYLEIILPLPHIPTIWLILFEMCQPAFHLIYLRSFCVLELQPSHQVWIQLRKSVFLDIHTYLINRTLSTIFAYLKHLTNFDQ